MVESQPSKLLVAGSNPVSRSKKEGKEEGGKAAFGFFRVKSGALEASANKPS